MKRNILLTSFLILTIGLSAQIKQENNHHKIFVEINIEESFIDITDTIYLSNNKMKTFYLNSNLTIYSSSCELEKVSSKDRYTIYKLKSETNKNSLTVRYKGIIDHNKEALRNITRKNMFQSTSGVIFDKGIYLGGNTYWIPDFESADLKTFEIDVNIDKNWKLISQGNLVSTKEKETTKVLSFKMDDPTNQVCLIGNKWTKYSRRINEVDVNVYLINPDEFLAKKYLDATVNYLDLYYNTIGNYPYSKFDVIENFWESGYGMPSFTLLGKKVMRFPWILNTSYPHELLHNYWGNSVYVDYDQGNWCEGITTYMADHLLKEKESEGAIYRRSTLKKYSDYVNQDNDFPVKEFRSKFDEASDAIGYGKVLMFNHMLRIKYGTDIFYKSYGDFYKRNKFKKASFNDIKNSFEKITGDSLGIFFDQWINSTGAPVIELEKVKVKKKKDQYILSFDLVQNSSLKPFIIDIPVFIYLKESKEVKQKVISLNKMKQSYSFTFNENPIRIDIDPLFDVMRKLKTEEVPPTLSQILGSNKWTIILPKESKAYFYYKNLAISWSNMYTKKGKEIKIVNDSKIEEIPKDQSVWVLGKENKFVNKLNIRTTYNSIIDHIILDKIDSLNNNELVVYTLSNPNNKNETIGYVNSNDPSTIGQLTMKFIHYSNFSYLGFESKSFKNTLKGNFPVLDSPLNYIINKKHSVDWSLFKFPETDALFK